MTFYSKASTAFWLLSAVFIQSNFLVVSSSSSSEDPINTTYQLKYETIVPAELINNNAKEQYMNAHMYKDHDAPSVVKQASAFMGSELLGLLYPPRERGFAPVITPLGSITPECINPSNCEINEYYFINGYTKKSFTYSLHLVFSPLSEQSENDGTCNDETLELDYDKFVPDPEPDEHGFVPRAKPMECHLEIEVTTDEEGGKMYDILEEFVETANRMLGAKEHSSIITRVKKEKKQEQE